MPVTFIQSGRFGAPSSYHADATALFARWGTDPGTTRKDAVNACIQGMDDDTDWALIDEIQIYAAHTQADGLLGWKNNSDATLTGGPTFTTDRGVTTDGSTNQIETGFVPSTDGVNFTQNSACLGIYINSVGANTASNVIYACGNGALDIVPRDASGHIRARPNTSGIDTYTSVTPGTRAGFTTTNRSASGTTQGYRNGSSVGTGVSTSTALSSNAVWAGGRNSAGTLTGGIDARFAVFLVAGSLDATRQGRVYNRILTYLTAIGAN